MEGYWPQFLLRVGFIVQGVGSEAMAPDDWRGQD